jgi:hypothetical protein
MIKMYINSIDFTRKDTIKIYIEKFIQYNITNMNL